MSPEITTIDIQKLTLMSDSAAMIVNPIGRAAWSSQLSQRPIADIDQVYGSPEVGTVMYDELTNLQKAYLAPLAMRRWGTGVVIAAYAPELTSRPFNERFVGYALMRPYLPGNALSRFGRSYFRRGDPTAFLQDIAVLPSYQHRGIASALVAAQSKELRHLSRTTTECLVGNEQSYGFLRSLGYTVVQGSLRSKQHFGADTKPALAWTLQAELYQVERSASEHANRKASNFTTNKYVD
ncbi:GNAT family N-acetyltransferase [Candidatus Saccharibacteria bacterium]|nr:GNAT family N-acetyltransferase [Candidatus Saccharibacteria bacterium]